MHLDAIQIVPFHHEGKFLEPRGEDVCEELPLVMNARNLWWGLNGSETMGWAEGENFWCCITTRPVLREIGIHVEWR